MQYLPGMDISFQKMHGTLNDFVVFHDLSGAVQLGPEQVARICDRRAGVGADGVIIVRPSQEADFFMDYVNADGSVAEMCGNGIRCLAKYVYDNGLTDRTTLPVETRAGIKTVNLFPSNDGKIAKVSVDMGEPVFEPDAIPVNLESSGKPILDQVIEVRGRSFQASILSMGNPHCVIVTEEELDGLPLRYGSEIENHRLFPAKTNVEFIRIKDRNHIVMRVWERGSGETLACGTGACASAVAARLKGLVQADCVVELRGGNLDISWKGINYPVLMTGACELVYKGILTL
jgi:diaminopimelate epimerase